MEPNVVIIHTDVKKVLEDMVALIKKEAPARKDASWVTLCTYEQLRKSKPDYYPNEFIDKDNYVIASINKYVVFDEDGNKITRERSRDLVDLKIKKVNDEFIVEKNGYVPLFMHDKLANLDNGSDRENWNILTYEKVFVEGIATKLKFILDSVRERGNTRTFNLKPIRIFVNKMRTFDVVSNISRNGQYKIQNRIRVIPAYEEIRFPEAYVDTTSRLNPLVDFVKELGLSIVETRSFKKGTITFSAWQLHKAIKEAAKNKIPVKPWTKDNTYDASHPFLKKNGWCLKLDNKGSDRIKKLVMAPVHKHCIDNDHDDSCIHNPWLTRTTDYLRGVQSKTHVNILAIIDSKKDYLEHFDDPNGQKILMNILKDQHHLNTPYYEGIAGSTAISSEIANIKFRTPTRSFAVPTNQITEEFKALILFLKNTSHTIQRPKPETIKDIKVQIDGNTPFDWERISKMIAGYSVKCCGNLMKSVDNQFKTFKCQKCNKIEEPKFDGTEKHARVHRLAPMLSGTNEVTLKSIKMNGLNDGYKITYKANVKMGKSRVIDPDTLLKTMTSERDERLMPEIHLKLWDPRYLEFKDHKLKAEAIIPKSSMKGDDMAKHIGMMRLVNALNDPMKTKVEPTKITWIDPNHEQTPEIMAEMFDKSEAYYFNEHGEQIPCHIGIFQISVSEFDYMNIADEKPIRIGTVFEHTLNLMEENDLIKSLRNEQDNPPMELMNDLTSIVGFNQTKIGHKPIINLRELTSYFGYIGSEGNLDAHFQFINQFPLFTNPKYKDGVQIPITLIRNKETITINLVTPSLETMKQWISISNEVQEYSYHAPLRELLNLISYIRQSFRTTNKATINQIHFNRYIEEVDKERRRLMNKLVNINLFGAKSKLISSPYLPLNTSVISSKAFWKIYFQRSEFFALYKDKEKPFEDFMHDVITEKVKIHGLNIRYPILWMTQNFNGQRILTPELANKFYRRIYPNADHNMFNYEYDAVSRKFYKDDKTPSLYKNYTGGMTNEFETVFRDQNDNDGDIFCMATPLTWSSQQLLHDFTKTFSTKEIVLPSNDKTKRVSHLLQWHMEHFIKEAKSNCDFDPITRELNKIKPIEFFKFKPEDRINSLANNLNAQATLGPMTISMWQIATLLIAVYYKPDIFPDITITLSDTELAEMMAMAQIMTQKSAGTIKGINTTAVTLRAIVKDIKTIIKSGEDRPSLLIEEFLEITNHNERYKIHIEKFTEIIYAYAKGGIIYDYVDAMTYLASIDKQKKFRKGEELLDEVVARIKSEIPDFSKFNQGIDSLYSILD